MKTPDFTSRSGKIELHLGDCMELMKDAPDKFYQLCIVDVPYGIGASEMTMGSGKNKKWDKGKKWDNEIPKKLYWDELFRISENQIIWGANYLTEYLQISRGWIFWDKGIDGDCSFADGELAWTSFDRVLRKAPIRYKGFLGADRTERFHPTAKPIALYSWLLKNYAKTNDRIFDSHLGSGSIAIAVHKANEMDGMNLQFTGIEIDSDYFTAAVKRFKTHEQQTTIFT